MQVSYRFCTKIPQTGNLQKYQSRRGANTRNAMQKIEIIEAECCPDHIHMLVRIPPKYSVSEIVGYLKGKSSLMIFEKHANLKYKYGNRHFWCRGYYVDTAGKNTKKIQEYIRNQLKEDQAAEQLVLDLKDPFNKK